MKKTTVYMLLVVAGVISITFYSCLKAGNRKEKAAYVPLNFSQVNLGEVHNDLVRKVYRRYSEHLKRGAGNRLSEVPLETQGAQSDPQLVRELVIAELRATPIDATVIGITDEEYYSTATGIMDDLSANDFDIRNFPTPMCSQAVMVYVRNILNTIESRPSLNEINAALEEIAAKSAAELQGIEQDEVTGILEIARASAYLWSDEDGLYNTAPVDVNARTMSSAKKVMIADVSASASFFLRMGIMGAVFASTPGSNVVILSGWALSAGISSACAALFSTQYNLTLPRDLPLATDSITVK